MIYAIKSILVVIHFTILFIISYQYHYSTNRADMNNLHIFRKAVNTFAEDSCIDDVEKWKNLMEYLCDQKILHPQ